MLCLVSRAATRWPAWQTTTSAPMSFANRRLQLRTSRCRPWVLNSMRLTSSGAWTVYASSASSSSSPTVRSLFASRLPPRMTPRFWGQTSTKSGPALFSASRSSAILPWVKRRLMMSKSWVQPTLSDASIYSYEEKMNRGGKVELSSYEDYTRKSGNYDKTREPVGTEILVGCFAHALLGYVGRIEAVDINPSMLEVAARKLAWAGDRISFHSSRIEELPFEDANLDG